MAEIAAARGLPTGWWYSDAEREAIRRRDLCGQTGDLWVFAYGSLMWDPALRFDDLRRAFLPDHARRFILKDTYGARGTAAAPGLMAALDLGPGCEGLAFRIPRPLVEDETRILWQRERIGPAYRAEFLDARTASGPLRVLAFLADHDAAQIEAELPRDEQVRCLATGEGFLGTSLDYIRGIETRLACLGIEDPDVTALRRDAEACAARLSGT